MKKTAFLIMIGLCLLAMPAQAQINLLHEFAGGSGDGDGPKGSLVLSGSHMYGMTYSGGDSDKGTIFKIQINGTGFTLLHEFAGGADDGANPWGSLIISGSTLYGMTKSGGDYDCGTIFKIGTDGSGFSLVREFAGGTSDGKEPFGDLVISSSYLYGMTSKGGDNDMGMVFKVNVNGTSFTRLHEFAGGAGDGHGPYMSALVLSGATLYGMTRYGGDLGQGVLFKVQISGTYFTVLHEFAGGADDGSYPYGSLIISDSTLYGMTDLGGDGFAGTIFKIQTDGTGFTLLREFVGGNDDGENPYGSLKLSGSTLYGMTSKGGDDDNGVVFKINVNGTNFTRLHEFAGGGGDGATPYGFLLLSGTTLYGLTSAGGDVNRGVIFSLPVVETVAKDDFVATWDGQGVYYRNSDTAAWVKLASPATLITVGDLDNDAIDDIIGIWPSQDGVWVKYSKTSTWANLSSTAKHIATGDMNGDGRPELLGTWDGQGVYWRNNATGAWTKLATPATLITAGDLDGDGTGDLIGIWPSQGGVWVKYSQTGSWAKLSTTAVDIATGDMNGDGRDDLVATWDGQGVYYRDSIGSAWVKMATPATQVTAGDLDGDGTDDVIGIWPSQEGVWVKYSQTGAWANLSSTAVDITAGRMRAAGSASLLEPGATVAGSENDWGPDASADALDLSANPTGRISFVCPDSDNMEPRESGEVICIPGPGEPGFRCQEQENLVPGSGLKRKLKATNSEK